MSRYQISYVAMIHALITNDDSRSMPCCAIYMMCVNVKHYNAVTVYVHICCSFLQVTYILLSVNEYLQLIHSDIFIEGFIAMTHPQFNVVRHFLAQCGSEPRTTTATAGAIYCTPL